MENIIEKDLRVCKVCLKEKNRIQHGRYPDTKNRKFVDETGRLWSGRTCPECHAMRQRDNKRKKDLKT